MPLSHRDYAVACICPMGVELAPVTALLDKVHPSLPTQRDQNSYTLGEIEGHNIVIAVLPEIGTNAAAVVTTQLLNDFPSIRFGLLVGIGGGVPDVENEVDVRLGDIVVSKPTKTAGGVVQYDMGKETLNGFERVGTLDKPPQILRAAVQQLAARHELEDSHVPSLMAKMLDMLTKLKEKYSHPGAEQDQLFESIYDHQGGRTCLRCDHSQVISRPPRSTSVPIIHYGTIGSANRVIKNAGEREKLKSNDLDILCVEMEAAGLMDSFPCLVIRGICDYADSHKNKKWQPYAAASAAAYMKELLSIIPVKDVVKTSRATDVVQIPNTRARIPDVVRDSKLSVQFFHEYLEQVHFTSDGRARRQQKTERWSRVKSLGRRASGTVWLEKCLTAPGELRAVKEIVKLSQSTGPSEYSRELEAIAKFSHQKYNGCFVQSFGWYENAEAVFVTLEYFPHGDLQKYLTKPLPEEEAQQITYQILEGVTFMHENEYAHRDLKPANILVASVSPSWWVKIGDFGISKRAEEGATVLRTVSGTPGYLAPELLGFIDLDGGSDFSYTTAIDIWAVGEITFRMLSGGESPFQNLNAMLRYVEGRLSFPSEELFAHGVSQEAYAFTKMLMTGIPVDRPSAEDALNSGWLKSQRNSFEHGSDNELPPNTDIGASVMTSSPLRFSHPTTQQESAQQSSSSIFMSLNPPAGFDIQKPSTDEEIERLFMELMNKRDWQNFPGEANSAILSYSTEEKWALVHQEMLAEWRGEKTRRQTAPATGRASDTVATSEENGSPLFFVSMLMDDTFQSRLLQNLNVMLRIQPITWVKRFIEFRGQTLLANALLRVNRHHGSRPVRAVKTRMGSDALDRECDILKCLQSSMSNNYGAYDALADETVPFALATCLISPRLATKNLANEVLRHLCVWADGVGHRKVLQAMDHLKVKISEMKNSDTWMKTIEDTIDERLKTDTVASTIPCSRGWREGTETETLFREYLVSTLILINMMIDAPEKDLQLRCAIRAQFIAAGIQRILTKMEGFQHEIVGQQIKKFWVNETNDRNLLAQERGQHDRPH